MLSGEGGQGRWEGLFPTIGLRGILTRGKGSRVTV